MHKVSIVVPIYNGGGLIKQCVESLTRLEYPTGSLQIIIVDDASTDGTAEWLKSLVLPAHFQRIFHRINRGPSAAAARNSALQHVQGDVVIFLDGDLSVRPDFVRAHYEAVSQPEVVAVAGRVTAGADVRDSKLKRYLYDSPRRAARQFGESAPIPFQFLITNNMSIRREVLDAVGVFDEGLTGYGGEDTLFAYHVWRRHPGGIRFSNRAISFDHDEHSLDTLLAKFSHYGEYNLHTIVQKHPETAKALRADWEIGRGFKTISGHLLFNTFGNRFVKELLPLIPYPLSNFAIRYLIGSVVIMGLRRGRRLARE